MRRLPAMIHRRQPGNARTTAFDLAENWQVYPSIKVPVNDGRGAGGAPPDPENSGKTSPLTEDSEVQRSPPYAEHVSLPSKFTELRTKPIPAGAAGR